MYFNHYTNRPVRLAVDLVNTDQTDHDAIGDPELLVEFLEGYRELWEGVAQEPKLTDLAAVQRLRAALRTVMSAPDEESATEAVNQILKDYGAMPRVSLHSGAPHLHFEPINSTLPSWLGATTAMGLAAVIVEHGLERFGVCDASDCKDVYVDSSRNRSRRHCSNTCSTREAVAAYRKRKAE